MAKIEFSMENILKCLCSKCAVQIESSCVKDKQKIMLLMTQQDLDSPMRMDSERVPGVYCATGQATCNDIDTKKVCKCNECTIWDENNLKFRQPGRYFCRDGEAKK
jgi:NifB/MoaA-like Fe-S oxidoreductase